MDFKEAFILVMDLAHAMPALFDKVEIELAFGDANPSIGDWSDPTNLGMLVTGDGVGCKSGVYFFGSPESEILYIGKATKNNLHHRVWDHVKTPNIREDGRRTFPNHRFTGFEQAKNQMPHVLSGEARIAVVTVSDPEVVSLIEVYLHTAHKKRHGTLPAFNRQIG
ncbi:MULTISPECIES: hypothetical protein [unclassified Pseudomonas]|uniref:hypothetical protein n=1 Tax=unclassified Pseudomonas TaxID=196821 RepID=UPI001595548B|nr:MULTISPECIES: hypothetical protein [unclassified Pseudomonas]